MSDSLQPHESQHARPPCPSPAPGVYSNSCPSSRWCHPVISSSVVPFCSYPQSLPASGSFPMSQLFAWAGRSIGVSASASVPPMYTQGRFQVLSSRKYMVTMWGKDILISFTAVIISLYISNPHLVHLKYVQFFYFLKKDPKINKKKAVLNIC